MRWSVVLGIIIAILISGCTESIQTGDEGADEETQQETPPQTAKTEPKQYTAEQAFYTFKDPNEGAFTIEIPKGWQVAQGSGLIRPYIDAGIYLEAKSDRGQGMYYISPHGYIYVTPNAVLEMAGFKEGSQYDPSGSLAKPMIVMRYIEAKDFVYDILKDLAINADIKEVVERPDLTMSSPLITKQSAAEITYTDRTTKTKHKGIAYIYLVELQGIGVWAVTYFDYYAPEEIFGETELLVFRMKESFKVDKQWAAREAQEVAKRTQIISQTQEDISGTISSTFEYRSKTMDETADRWSKRILEIEDVYDPDTGDHYVVGSGSKYYWIDDRNNIYGTDVDQPPSYQENWKKMACPDCN